MRTTSTCVLPQLVAARREAIFSVVSPLRGLVPAAVVRSASSCPRKVIPATVWTEPLVTVHPWERRRAAVASESWLPIVATFFVELGTAWVSASTHTRSGSDPVMVRSPSSMWMSAPESWSRTPEKAMTSRLQCRSVVSTAVLRPRSGTDRAPVTEIEGVAVARGLSEGCGAVPGSGSGPAFTRVFAEEALTRL